MGTTSPIPQYKAMRFFYTDNNVKFYGNVNIDGSAYSGGSNLILNTANYNSY